MDGGGDYVGSGRGDYNANPPRYEDGDQQGRGYGRSRGRGRGRARGGLNFRDRQEPRPCKFFAAGECRFGDQCRNLHVEGSQEPHPCKFFAQGNCRFGDQCRNVHVTEEN